MRHLSNEGTFGFMILIVICLTFYMHTFLLDNSRNDRIPTITHVKYSVNVMVAVIMHHPSRFLKTTLSSLNESVHEGDVFIFRNFVGDHLYHDALQWYPKAKVVPDKKRGNSTDIMRFVMDQFVSSKYDVLVYINSYSVLSNDWWAILKKCLDKSRGVFSLYGIERDKMNSDMCDDLLCFQQWLGIMGSVWRRNLATRMLSETSKVKGRLNSKMEHWCRLYSIPMQSVRNSVLAVIDGEKRNYTQITHKASLQLKNKQVIDEKLKSRGFTNFSNTLQNKKQLSDNKLASDKEDKAKECIAAVLRVRIYREDKSETTAYEVEQGIRYMQFAGVNVIYFYDAYEAQNENLEFWVKQVFEPDEVLYHDWYFNRTFDVRESRRLAYQHATDHYKHHCQWHIHLDMNEYPFMVNDTGKGFLKRLISKIKSLKLNCTEISFPIFRFSGSLTQDPWLIARLQSRHPNRVTGEVVPLYIATHVKTSHLYHNKLDNGTTEYLDPKLARINRYLTTADTSGELLPDSTIIPLLGKLRQDTLISNKMPLYVTNRFWDSKH